MNVRCFGDATGQKNTFRTEFEGLRHVFSALHASTAQYPNLRVDRLNGSHRVAHNGRVGRCDRDVSANQLRRFNGDVGRIELRQRLGFFNVGGASTHWKTIGKHVQKLADMVEVNLVFCVVDDRAFCASMQGGLGFKPTREAAKPNRVKVLRPDLNSLCFLRQNGQIKRRSDRHHCGRAISMGFHGSEKRLCFISGGGRIGFEIDNDHWTVHASRTSPLAFSRFHASGGQEPPSCTVPSGTLTPWSTMTPFN